MRARDAQRSDVYLAEEVAFDGTILAERPGGTALRAALDEVLRSPWWRSNVGDPARVRRVTIRAAADSHWAQGTGTLALDPNESWFVITHELAHVAVVPAEEVHGASWRGWNCALVEAAFGTDLAGLLRASFDRFSLATTRPQVVPVQTPLLSLAPTAPVRGGWRPDRSATRTTLRR